MRELLAVADCNVCGPASDVLVLVALGTTRLLFFCPVCGNCTTTVQPPGRLDEINALEDLAPDGARLATRLDLARSDIPAGTVRIGHASYFDYLPEQVRRAAADD